MMSMEQTLLSGLIPEVSTFNLDKVGPRVT
jgi:hypothetical protein